MSWKDRLRNKKTVRALVAAGLLIGGGSLALVEPFSSLVCVVVGCA